VNIQSYIGS